jgi:hypothetical protein
VDPVGTSKQGAMNPSLFLRRLLRLIPLVGLAAAGFLIGVYWTNLSALIGPLLAIVAALWADGESYVQSHPAESGVLFAVIGALILPLWNLSGVILHYLFRRKSIIDLVFASEDQIHMVTAHMRQTSFERIGTKQIIHLPSNAPFLPSSVAVGGALIYSYAHQRYGDSKPAWLHFDNENWGSDEHNFISIGGPFVNVFAKEIVEGKRIPGFQLTDTPTAIDEQHTFEALRETSGGSDAPLLTDYGFIIYVKNPRKPAKRICLAFGLWPPGTQAAVAVIIDPLAQPWRYRNQLRNAIRKDKNVIAIVKVTINGLFLEQTEIVKVRQF